jgi:DNA-binding beta-propeller fold protein YncE
LPGANGANASQVLGQLDFGFGGQGNGAANLTLPAGLWTDGERLAVADSGNNRVLLWLAEPLADATPADLVLGWSTFGQGAPAASPPTSASLNQPFDVYSDGVRLYVADAGNNRVLVWNTVPGASNRPADFVIGQATMTTSSKNAGKPMVNAMGFDQPTGVCASADALFVVDHNNNRVLVFSPIPDASGPEAVAVLGQDSFTSGAVPAIASAEALGGPYSCAVAGNHLYVTDAGFHRVLRYALN